MATLPAPGTACRLRLHLIGSSAAGKTALGRALARALGLPFVDLDERSWEPGWQAVSHADLARRVMPTLAQPGCVIVGNDRATTERYFWPRITHRVVLDLPLATLLRRTVWRTLRRGLTGEPCGNGNRESLVRVFHRDGLVRCLLRNWRSRHERPQRLADAPALAHARKLHPTRHPTLADLLEPLATPTHHPPPTP